LRGDVRANAPLADKVLRVLRFYGRLLRYVIRAQPKVLHILWNNRLEVIDRTLLLLLYRLLGKRVVFTVHNVNMAERDNRDHRFNRATLRFQYQRLDHLFVHTRPMKDQLHSQFGVRQDRISVIPFGINDSVPRTALNGTQARERLGLGADDRCVLFFGNIAPYKGLEYLVQAVARARTEVPTLRLVIAGRTKGSEAYWQSVRQQIEALGLRGNVIERIEFVPDEEIELYFKAADVLALPYAHVFQSGVLFLGYNFGLPVIASDIASFREDIIEGETGFICAPADPTALATTLQRYFESELYRCLDVRREQIRSFAAERYSWSRVADITTAVYRRLQGPDRS
jgi:glycosyltransferase involved in cell wall biosynthesis